MFYVACSLYYYVSNIFLTCLEGITQVIQTCQIPDGLFMILMCYLTQFYLLERGTDVLKEVFLKTCKPPPPTLLMRIPNCSEQLF